MKSRHHSLPRFTRDSTASNQNRDFRFHDTPHQSIIDFRVAVDEDIAKGDDVLMVANLTCGIGVNLQQLIECFADDLELTLDRGA